MGSLLTRLAALTAAAAALASCNTSGCTENQSAIPLAGFYDSATGSAISLDSIGVEGVGAPGDSMLVRPGETVSQVYLPLRSTEASAQYCLSYRGEGLTDNTELYDTLTFVYAATPYFAGEECGAAYRYNITQFRHTDHLIDSVALADRVVTNTDRELLKIFFKVSSPSGTPETSVAK